MFMVTQSGWVDGAVCLKKQICMGTLKVSAFDKMIWDSDGNSVPGSPTKKISPWAGWTAPAKGMELQQCVKDAQAQPELLRLKSTAD